MKEFKSVVQLLHFGDSSIFAEMKVNASNSILLSELAFSETTFLQRLELMKCLCPSSCFVIIKFHKLLRKGQVKTSGHEEFLILI